MKLTCSWLYRQSDRCYLFCGIHNSAHPDNGQLKGLCPKLLCMQLKNTGQCYFCQIFGTVIHNYIDSKHNYAYSCIKTTCLLGLRFSSKVIRSSTGIIPLLSIMGVSGYRFISSVLVKFCHNSAINHFQAYCMTLCDLCLLFELPNYDSGNPLRISISTYAPEQWIICVHARGWVILWLYMHCMELRRGFFHFPCYWLIQGIANYYSRGMMGCERPMSN